MSSSNPIIVVGSGLAGSQAALTIARLGGKVKLYEMRPVVKTPAHRTSMAAELVCSNSLRSNQLHSAPGLLKEELRMLGSDLLRIAEQTAIPGGSALTVDREQFSRQVTTALESDPNIDILREELQDVPVDGLCVLATGPLTSDRLANSIQTLTGEANLSFYDAINPVIDVETISLDKVFAASRYSKGGPDFLNCPMNSEEYTHFREALLKAEGIFTHEFDDLNFFGCPPLEQIARSGKDTLRYGPLKPVGLLDPATGHQPYAVVQLRQENLRCDSYNMVGFQNQLKFGEQERVFRMIPGLERAEFIRFGQMHRNTYVRAPALLEPSLRLRMHSQVFLAGQICGVEGYVEAMATGLLAGINAWRLSESLPLLEMPRESAIGSVCHYLARAEPEDFAPVRFTFDLLPPVEDAAIARDRNQRRAHQCRRATAKLDRYLQDRKIESSLEKSITV